MSGDFTDPDFLRWQAKVDASLASLHDAIKTQNDNNAEIIDSLRVNILDLTKTISGLNRIQERLALLVEGDKNIRGLAEIINAVDSRVSGIEPRLTKVEAEVDKKPLNVIEKLSSRVSDLEQTNLIWHTKFKLVLSVIVVSHIVISPIILLVLRWVLFTFFE
jgi:hypothetical protein